MRMGVTLAKFVCTNLETFVNVKKSIKFHVVVLLTCSERIEIEYMLLDPELQTIVFQWL